MMTCKEMVKTVSSRDRSFFKRGFAVQFHLIICYHCRVYLKQLKYLRSGITKLFAERIAKAESDYIEKVESEVIKKLRQRP
jgi:hypothetical protein